MKALFTMKKSICGMEIICILCAAVMMGCGAAVEKPVVETNEGRIPNRQITECDEKTEEAGTVLYVDSEEANKVQMYESETDGTPRMLCIGGEIYYDTGRISEALRCGVMDWIIDYAVPEDEMPTEDNQSNFGTGYGYQRWSKGQVHVNIDDKWHIFQASEVYRLTVTNGNNGALVELERSPKFWEIIEKYQNLDVTAQNKQVDNTGYSYCLRLYDKEDNLIATVTPMSREINLDGAYYFDNGYGTVAELQLVLDTLFEKDCPEATASEVVPERDNAAQNPGTEETTQDEARAAGGNIDVLEDVYMSVTYATDKGANLVLMNYSDKNMECGDDYELQMLKDGEWYRVDYIIDNWAFNAIAYGMPKNEPVSMYVDWTHFHGILPEGQYRIVKSVMDFRGTGDYTIYRLGAEFEVK